MGLIIIKYNLGLITIKLDKIIINMAEDSNLNR